MFAPQLAFAPLSAWLSELPPPDLGNLTATAILGWYAWHTARHTLPALVRHFREELAAMRDDGRAARETFRQALAEERAQRRADQAAVVEALHALARQLSKPETARGALDVAKAQHGGHSRGTPETSPAHSKTPSPRTPT